MPDHEPSAPTGADDPFTTPEVEQAYQDMVEQSGEEAINLGSYTDEEIVALTFDGMDRPVPTPWLDSLEPHEHELAVAGGMRSLTVRGLVEALPLDDVSGTVQQTSPPEVWALVRMRRQAPTTIVAERATTLGTDWIVLYEAGQGRWLAEFITATGFHELVLATAEDTAFALLGWSGVVPDSPVPDLDVRLTVEQVEGEDPRLERVGASLVAVTLSRTTLADPDQISWSGLYSGPDGSYLSRREPDGLVRFRGESFETVEGFVDELLQES